MKYKKFGSLLLCGLALASCKVRKMDGAKTYADEGADGTEFSPFEKELAKALMLSDLATAGATVDGGGASTKAPDNFGTSKDQALAMLEQLVASTKYDEVRFVGVERLVRAYELIDVDDKYHKTEALTVKYLANCNSFVSCSRVVRGLGAVVDIIPNALVRTPNWPYEGQSTIEEKLRPQIEKLPDTTAREIVMFKFNSVTTLAHFNAMTRLTAPNILGTLPIVRSEDLQNVVDLLNSTQGPGMDLLRRSQDGFHSIVMKEVSSYDQLNEHEKQTIDFIVGGITEGIRRTVMNNEALAIYIERIRSQENGFRDPNPESWLKSLEQRNPELAVVTLLRFISTEMFLPWRRQYYGTLARMADRVPRENAEYEGFQATIKGLGEQISAIEIMLHKFHEAQNFDKLTKNPLDHEKAYATNVAWFGSWFNMSRKYFDSSARLDVAVRKVTAALEGKSEAQVQEIAKTNFDYATDAVLAEWLTAQCAQFVVLKKTNGPILSSTVTFPIDESKLDLNVYCAKFMSEQMPLALVNYPSGRRAIDDAIMNKTWKRRWGPVMIEGAILAAMIPMTLTSSALTAGASQATGKFIARVATRYAIQTATTTAARSMAIQLGKRMAIHAMRSAYDCFLFTVFNHALLTGYSKLVLARIEPGLEIPFYDKNRSFWSNYGKELAMGSFVFGVLPFVMPYTSKFGVAFAKSTNVLKSDIYAGVSSRLAAGAADAVFFTGIHITEKSIARLAGSNDPIFTSWSQLMKDYGAGAAIALGFRMHGVMAESL